LTSPATVSAIIPTYNGAAYLAKALGSVRGQTHGDIELIVVDDGSSDTSIDIARSYAATVITQSRQGPGAARNAGIRASSGQYLAFLDQDDIWHPEKIEQQLALCPTADYIICRAVEMLEASVSTAGSISRDAYVQGAVAPTPSALLVSRTVFERVGWFDERYRYNSDVAWFLAAKNLGLRMAAPDMILLTKRFHDHNQGRDVAEAQQELLRVFRDSMRKAKA
jgi:glycosyltransferase involved in cell wall biosynthesis